MQDCDAKNSPMERKLDLSKCGSTKTQQPYRELIGCGMYIALGTRPDIMYAITYFARFQEKATDTHYRYLLRLLAYLKGTIGMKLHFRVDERKMLTGYVDADWAGNPSDRKSTSGFIFMLYGAAISWSSRKQSLVALSTSESEYIALSAAIQEGQFLVNLVEDFGIAMNRPITLYEDNNACISIAENANTTKRSKHFSVRYFYVKDNIEKGDIKLEKVS